MINNFNINEMLRMFKRNKSTNILSIAGLSIGIAIALLIGIWGFHEFSFDNYHKNGDRIYRICRQGFLNNELVQLGSDFGPVSVVAKERFPEIEDITRLKHLTKVVVNVNNENTYEEGIFAADKNFFSFFSFTLEKGNPQTCLDSKDKIVIDRYLANKLFGSKDAVGQIIGMYNQKWQVSAVMNDIPQNSHLRPHALIRIESISWLNGDNWGNNDDYIGYFLLRPGADHAKLAQKINAMTYEFMPMYKQLKIQHFLQPLMEIHFSPGFRFDLTNTSDRRIVFILLTIASIILLIACFNFINLYISTSFLRAKSIGIKKINGSTKFNLFIESFGETTFYVLISLVVGLILVSIALPFFNQFTTSTFEIHWSDYRIYLFTGVLLILTSLVAGAFPVYYITRFNPEEIIRNRFKGKGVSFLQKTLVISQFAASILLIGSAGIIKKQLHYIQNKDLGFSRDHIVYITPRGDLSKQYNNIKQELVKNPNILDVTVKSCLPSDWNNGGPVSTDETSGDERIMEICRIKDNYPDMMKIPVIAGINPFMNINSPSSECMLNEQAAKALGLKDPVGKKIKIADEEYIVAGILKDALTKSLHINVDPQVYLNIDKVQDYHVMMIKTGPNVQGALDVIKDSWIKANPDIPFEYHFLDEVYDSLYRSEKAANKIVTISMFIAIFLSFMALIAIAHYATERRIKEIGIRKVNGARVVEIMKMLNLDFVYWIIISFLVACPVTLYAMNKWLENFAFKTQLSWWIFGLSGLVALLITLITVSLQSYKAAVKNPVEAIRYE